MSTFIKSKTLIIPIILIAILFAVGAIVKNRAFNYDYNQQADYNYTFNTLHAIITLVKIADSIELPQLEANYNTAFLEIDIKPSLLSYWNMPEIRIDSLLQNFECGARGIRYLNLSGIPAGKKVALKMRYCSLAKKQARLICFANPKIENASILVLSPHPDDAEIAAYGLYSQSKNAYIATITAGEAGKRKYYDHFRNTAEHYATKGKLRVWNSITVPLLAGLKPDRAVNLGYFDGTLEAMAKNDTLHVKSKYSGITDIKRFRAQNLWPLPDSLKAEATWRSLIDDLKFLLVKTSPKVIVSPFPAIDFHPDHKYTTLALLQAMSELHYTPAYLLLYTNHLAKPEYYPLGEQGSAVSVPPYFNSKALYFDRIYSHPLTETEQIDKLFALDAMNDLRWNAEWETPGKLFDMFWERLLNGINNTNNSYYRRSVRSNELFYVIDSISLLNNNIRFKISGL